MQHFSLSDIDIYLMPLPADLPKREAEKQAKAEMLRTIFGQETEIIYTPEGKPTVAHGYLSISHSKNYLCMAYSQTQEVGIDVEEIQPRISRLATRFLTAEELEACGEDLSLLTRCWSSKEAIYKIVGAEAGAIGEHIFFEVETLHEPTLHATCKGRNFTLQHIAPNETFSLILATEIKA